MTDGHAFADREHAAERYLLGEMSDADRDRYEEHVFSCEECAEDVRTTAAFLDDVRAYVAPNGLTRTTVNASPVATIPVATAPVTLVPKRASTSAAWYRSPIIPWAMAASLLLSTGYQSLVLVPGLRDQPSSRGLYPVTLRPESRGQQPVVQTGASDGFTLAIEINDVQEGTLMEYKVATVGGRLATSGRLEAPRAGTALLLWLAASVLEEPGRYELSVHDVATGRLLGSYPFVRSN